MSSSYIIIQLCFVLVKLQAMIRYREVNGKRWHCFWG